MNRPLGFTVTVIIMSYKIEHLLLECYWGATCHQHGNISSTCQCGIQDVCLGSTCKLYQCCKVHNMLWNIQGKALHLKLSVMAQG